MKKVNQHISKCSDIAKSQDSFIFILINWNASLIFTKHRLIETEARKRGNWLDKLYPTNPPNGNGFPALKISIPNSGLSFELEHWSFAQLRSIQLTYPARLIFSYLLNWSLVWHKVTIVGYLTSYWLQKQIFQQDKFES